MQAGRIETSGRLGLLYVALARVSGRAKLNALNNSIAKVDTQANVAYQCKLMLNTNRPNANVDSMVSAVVWQLQFYVKLLVIVL